MKLVRVIFMVFVCGVVATARAEIASVDYVDAEVSDATNITTGTVDAARLPVGTTATTVAAGNDGRFDSVALSQPSGTPPTGRVWVWFD